MIVRFLLAILIGAFAATAAPAQETESRLNKILSPDKNRASNLQTKGFYGGKNFGGAGTAPVKDFYIAKQFSPMNFTTRQFYGAKDHWGGQMKFDTKDANTKGRYAIPNSSRAVPAEKVKTDSARESRKQYASRGFAGTKPATAVRGTAQGSIDEQYGSKAPMSIDQVRSLLNKNQ